MTMTCCFLHRFRELREADTRETSVKASMRVHEAIDAYVVALENDRKTRSVEQDIEDDLKDLIDGELYRVRISSALRSIMTGEQLKVRLLSATQ